MDQQAEQHNPQDGDQQKRQPTSAACLTPDEAAALCYADVLRSIYDEIYEADFKADTYRELYRGNVRFHLPPENLKLKSAICDIADSLIHPEDQKAFLRLLNAEELQKAESSGREHITQEVRKKCIDGLYRWARFTVFPLRRGHPGQALYMVCVQDIDEQKRAAGLARENELLQRQRLDNLRYKAVVDHTKTLVFEWRGREMAYASPRIAELLAGNYDGRHLFDVWREDGVLYAGDVPAFEACRRQLIQGAYSGEMTVRLRRGDGQFIWCKVSYSSLADSEPGVRYIGTINDVDAITRAQQALRCRAEYDPLTGAYNMQTFFAKAGEQIRERPDLSYFIVRFDVAGFKGINEVFGLEEGNRLLRAIAQQVRESLQAEGEIFARFTADVFAACLCGPPNKILQFIRRITDKLENYKDIFRVKIFFGICPVEQDTPVHVLCDWAYLAQKTVKGSDLVNYAFYDNALRKRIQDESYITDQMYEALENNQFQLYLQPKVEISSGRIVGSEALVRWQHPADGLILPNRFVPLFERNGFIVRLDEYIWELACKTLRLWLDKGYMPSPVSVNVSRLHFNDGNFCNKLLALTDKYRLPRHLLELELTESAFFANEKALIRLMRDLQAAGFIFSMDDFGTGYSSLSTLRDLPFNIVKLDRVFISDGTDNERGSIVARNTITMARQLEMKIVAEGVETLEQALFLLRMGCNCAQGYYYARPVDPEEFEVLCFIQEKAFWVDPSIQEQARLLHLPTGDAAPCREY